MEFFVYSPQWGGEPGNYLEAAANETLISDQSKKGKEEIEGDPYTTTHRWMTFEDNKGDYTQAVVSIKSDVTHHVLGSNTQARKFTMRTRQLTWLLRSRWCSMRIK